MMLGRITALHSKWLRYSPQGAMCQECQELNALHSSVVDGGSIKIPDRLLNPPQPGEGAPPFVLDVLHEDALHFSEQFQTLTETPVDSIASQEDADNIIKRLLTSEQVPQSEYELVQSAMKVARKYDLDFKRYLPHVHFSALTTSEKDALVFTFQLDPQEYPYIWNR